MRLADLSAQKLTATTYKCECGRMHEMRTQLFFCSNQRVKEVIAEKFPLHKTLFVTDRTERMFFSAFLPSDTMILLEGEDKDVRQLFAFPETINLIVAYGGKRVVTDARYFATVRGIKCVCVCAEVDAESLISRSAGFSLLDKKHLFPIKIPDLIFFNHQNLDRKTAKDAFISLAVDTLSLYELRFGELVLGKKGSCHEIYEIAYDVFLHLSNIRKCFDAESTLFEESLRWNFCKREGLGNTECGYLFSSLENDEKYSAYAKVLDVYEAFFYYGGLRKFAVPDYMARIRVAASMLHKSEFDVSEKCRIPSVKELEELSSSFERNRRLFALRAGELKSRKQGILDSYSFFGGIQKPADIRRKICALPELSGCYGIFSLMRDFGLLERSKAV